MHGLGAGLAAGLDDLLDHQIAFGRRRRPDQNGLIGHFDVQRVAVGLGIDRDRLYPHPAGSLDDPAGDLAAIGDQNSFEHVLAYLQPLGGIRSRRNLARGDGCNNSVVQQNRAEATVDIPRIGMSLGRFGCTAPACCTHGFDRMLATLSMRSVDPDTGGFLGEPELGRRRDRQGWRHHAARRRDLPARRHRRAGSWTRYASTSTPTPGLRRRGARSTGQADRRPPGPLRGSRCGCHLPETAYRHLHRRGRNRQSEPAPGSPGFAVNFESVREGAIQGRRERRRKTIAGDFGKAASSRRRNSAGGERTAPCWADSCRADKDREIRAVLFPDRSRHAVRVAASRANLRCAPASPAMSASITCRGAAATLP